MSHDIVFIRSQDRVGGVSNAFTVNLPAGYKVVSSMQLLSAEIPCSFYAISATYSTGVNFSNGTLTKVCSISSGNYAISDLQAALLSWLQSNFSSSGITAVTYSSVSGKITITFTTGTLSVVNNTSGSLARVLGTDALGATTSSIGTTLTFPGVCNLFPQQNLFINITNLQPNVLTTANFNSFFRCQITAPPGGIVFYNAASSVYNTVNFLTPLTNVSQLLITLTYSDGSAVLMNNQDWSLSIGFTYN